VIGAGHFGRYHAQKYAALPGAELVAVVDADAGRADAVAREVGSVPQTELDSVIGRIDAASVTVPTSAHHAVAARLLAAGIDVLIEKPIASTVEEADSLISLAQRHGCVLQVGHLQRFLLRRMEIPARVTRPLLIEATRVAPFKPRGTDVGVVLDLMIHDIDLILSLAAAPLVEVAAAGGPVATTTEDICAARLGFADGCVASVTASRVGTRTERRLGILQPSGYLSIDLAERVVTELRRATATGTAEPLREERSYPGGDDLAEQIADFVACVRERRPPLVGGMDGRRALETAILITRSLGETLARSAAPR
jgi:predicted dehydrogenase